MALTSTRLTAQEYFALPPTDRRTQLIDESLTTPLIPGFSLDVAELFDR